MLLATRWSHHPGKRQSVAALHAAESGERSRPQRGMRVRFPRDAGTSGTRVDRRNRSCDPACAVAGEERSVQRDGEQQHRRLDGFDLMTLRGQRDQLTRCQFGA